MRFVVVARWQRTGGGRKAGERLQENFSRPMAFLPAESASGSDSRRKSSRVSPPACPTSL